MTLLELNPKFIALRDGDDAVGMTFRCPHCPLGERGETTYLGIWFANPVIRGNHPDVDWPDYMLAHPDVHYWRRTGDDFTTLCITPSVDASGVGHWHGSITNGLIT